MQQVVANPVAWRGLRYPDSDVVGLVFRFARPGRDFDTPQPRAIDVGSGPGRHVRLLCELGFEAYGIDRDAEMCQTAQENGVATVLGDIAEFTPPEPLDLALCWGFAPLVSDAPRLMARLGARIVIADWRTGENSFVTWAGNEPLPTGGQRLCNPGHILHGQVYHHHAAAECELPGYDRIHMQRVTRSDANERNDWYQTVHRRQD